MTELLKLEVRGHQGSYSYSLLDLCMSNKQKINYAIQLYKVPSSRPHYKELAEHINR